MDVAPIAARTGWVVHHHEEVDSTNDEAAALARAGAGERVVVLANRQRAGRGRVGRAFASPEGGVYLSLLLGEPPAELPGGTVALVALAAAEAIEAVTDLDVAIKWPNDLWVDGLKVGGILLESAGAGHPVVAGIGVNLERVPGALTPEVRAVTGALEPLAGRPVERERLVEALLIAVDRLRTRRAQSGGADAIEQAWQCRMALLGRAVACRCAGAELEGVLEDVSLADGLLIRDPLAGPVWRRAEHVQDLRPI